MVKLTKIYTRGGDGGETSLGDGRRVSKRSPETAAIGAVDEANAAIGVARVHVARVKSCAGAEAMLGRIQNDLFDLGADLGMAVDSKKTPPRITQAQVERLENEIDALNAAMEPLDSFILPGGSEASAHLHVARTGVRGAERLIFELASETEINPAVLCYANRLSDHLFVLARHLNEDGAKDVKWKPGENG